MFLLVASAFAAFSDVPLTNAQVVAVEPYAITAARTLFPEAPATGAYPQVLSAAIQGETDVRLHISIDRAVEVNITFYTDVKGATQITEIVGHVGRFAQASDYQFEDVTLLTERVITELKTILAAAPYAFEGDIVTILAYRTQEGGAGGGGPGGPGADRQNHNAIFLDANRKVHSVVFHSTGGLGTPNQELTVSSFKSLP